MSFGSFIYFESLEQLCNVNLIIKIKNKAFQRDQGRGERVFPFSFFFVLKNEKR